MSLDVLGERIQSASPEVLAAEYLTAGKTHLFSDESAYNQFRSRVGALFTSVETVAIVGSGNWRYSLNPDKGFREFGPHSDVDIAVISYSQFHDLWAEMRENHRKHYYGLSYQNKMQLRRSSENVYAGFISPTWIPKRSARRIYEYKQMLNGLSDQTVGFLKVKMLFFKSMEEAVDYYKRGFVVAKGSASEI